MLTSPIHRNIWKRVICSSQHLSSEFGSKNSKGLGVCHEGVLSMLQIFSSWESACKYKLNTSYKYGTEWSYNRKLCLLHASSSISCAQCHLSTSFHSSLTASAVNTWARNTAHIVRFAESRRRFPWMVRPAAIKSTSGHWDCETNEFCVRCVNFLPSIFFCCLLRDITHTGSFSPHGKHEYQWSYYKPTIARKISVSWRMFGPRTWCAGLHTTGFQRQREHGLDFFITSES